MLVDLPTGTVQPNTSTINIEYAHIYSLANTHASCINDSSSFSVCNQIYSYFACGCGQEPSDTLQAITQILYAPYINVSDLYNISTPQAPFVGLSKAPNDSSPPHAKARRLGTLTRAPPLYPYPAIFQPGLVEFFKPNCMLSRNPNSPPSAPPPQSIP